MSRLPPEEAAPRGEPLLVILSGPSGVGKDAVLSRMKQIHFPLRYVVTMTTRPRRPMEKDGVDYQFVTPENFETLIREGQLLEHARVYGNWYGVPRKDVEEGLKAGEDVLVKVDVQGAETIKKAIPQAVAIFLAPPSREDLLTRLRQRSTESPEQLAIRLKTAEAEFERVSSFDYVVVNRWGEIDRAVEEIAGIIAVEKCPGSPAPKPKSD